MSIFNCKSHNTINCEHPDCKEIACLRWMLARISACVDGVVDRQYKKALKGCGKMAEEALQADYRKDNK